MSEELEEVLRGVVLVLYEQAREESEASYWGIADELSAIINESRGDDGSNNSK